MNNRLICRAYQICSSLLLRIRPVEKQEKITGAGSMAKVAALLEKRGITKTEIITTAGTVKRGMLAPLIEGLDAAGIEYAVFDGVRPDPDIECIEAAAELFVSEKCRAVIAVGGGSAMDCAKIAAAKAVRPGMSIYDMKGLLKIHRRLPFLAAVPTTAGTGSEITAAAVVTDRSRDYKFTVMDFCIVPSAAVLDPALTLGLPADVTAQTGMDAFTHAIEAYTNLFCSAKINDYAMKAMKLIDGNLEAAVEDGSDMKARESLLLGSYYAGIAFTNGYVGYVHAIAHAVGGLYHVPHGRACAVILPEVLESYGNAITPAMARIADELGICGGSGATGADLSDTEKKDAVISHIRELNRAVGITEKLGVKPEDVSRIAKRAEREANPAYPVPVIMNKRQLENVVRRLI